MHKRTSTLPFKRINTVGCAEQNTHARCVGCSSPVRVGMCYTGSVIAGMGFHTVNTTERAPITAVIETFTEHHSSPADFPDNNYVIGGESLDVSRKITYFKREKGYICDSCAANYHTVEDKSGRRHQIVMTDARPEWKTVPDERDGFRSNKGFNTRFTQGKLGKRY